MPEYRRFIAYFYEYIDGKKMNNVGFAKVELRSGMWRILFRLTAVHSPEPPVQVYGFVREKEYLLGLLMGTMRCGNQMLEEWAYRADTPIWKQQYGFSDLAGIWIQCGDGHRYVTVWDDDPIEINRFVLELPDKWDVKRTEVGENSETGEFVENSRKDGREPMTESENVQNEHIEKRAEKSEKEKRYAAAAEEGQKLSQYADGDAGKEAAAAGGAMDYVEAAQLAEDGIYTELSRRSTPSSPCDAIIQRREAFEPFGDTQFEACFKILPCDLIALQQAGRQTEALCSVCRDCRIRRNAIWHRPSASRISRLQNGKTTADHLGTIIRRDPRSGRIPYNLQTPRTKSVVKADIRNPLRYLQHHKGSSRKRVLPYDIS